MITIIDYGMGNLRSVQKALEHVGAKTKITQDAKDIEKAEKLVLPGVGAIDPAIRKLRSLKMIKPIKDFIASDKPFLGICLGLQLLFERSDEGGNVKGLGVFAGNVTRFRSLKVPHMGWNQLSVQDKKCPLFKNIKNGTDVYFCHSYFVQPKDKNIIAATTDYGKNFTSVVHQGNIFGLQFHPEKSQTAGLAILKNFVEI